MNPQDLAQATKAQVERATNIANATGIRRATVTATSPFTISMNGVLIVSPPKLPSYAPIVGDVVLVLMDGAAPLVVASLVSNWIVDDTRNPIVNLEQAGFGGSRGNATVISRYKINDGSCWWYGHYAFGSTTGWGSPGSIILMYPPGATPDTTFANPGASMPVFGVRAYRGSAGVYFPGWAEANYTGGGFTLWPTYTAGVTVPWSRPSTPFSWDITQVPILSWDLQYRIA